MLINNVRIIQVPEGRTADGFELQIGTNHLGRFAVTSLLLAQITDRVVVVTSSLHRGGRIQLDDLNWERCRYNSLQAYRDSKLADVFFASELQRRLTVAHSNARAIVAHPGVAPTALAGHVHGFAGFTRRRVTRRTPSARGGLPSRARLAAHQLRVDSPFGTESSVRYALLFTFPEGRD
jgi:NAD(P)-dependent dehydrogenase (short-subunit alcohol dehydrogenase family)